MFAIVPDDVQLLGYIGAYRFLHNLEKKFPGLCELVILRATPQGNLIYRFSVGRGSEHVGILTDPHIGTEPLAYTAGPLLARARLIDPTWAHLLKQQTLDVYFTDADLALENGRLLQARMNN